MPRSQDTDDVTPARAVVWTVHAAVLGGLVFVGGVLELVVPPNPQGGALVVHRGAVSPWK